MEYCLIGPRREPGKNALPLCCGTERTMPRDDTLAWIGGLALGAAAMYLLEPALQGGGGTFETDVVRERLLPVARAVCVTAGGLMVWWGARRGGFPGLLSSATGSALLTGAATALQPAPADAPEEGEGITVGHSIEVRAPVRDVFAFW